MDRARGAGAARGRRRAGAALALALGCALGLGLAGCGGPAAPPPRPLTLYPGKPGEIATPAAWDPGPTLAITPVPTGSDPGFDATPALAYTPAPPPAAADPYNLIIAADGWPGPTTEAVAYADAVVRGVVGALGAARWSTPDGGRPANPHATASRDYIFTPVTLDAADTLKGDPALRRYDLLAIGGAVGPDSVRWDGDDSQRFTVGQEVVVFLRRAGPGDRLATLAGRPLWKVTARYTIAPGPAGAPTAANVYRTLPLADLLREIRQASRP
jgi:hypothetical protein